MRTREQIEAQVSVKTATRTPKARKVSPKQLENLVAPWKPGQSGNPGGRPKSDMRQVIARAVFENNASAIYKAYTELLLRGSAFGYQVVGEAGYGKLKESRDTGSDFKDIPDTSLEERVAQLERECYPAIYPSLAREAGEAARAGQSAAGAGETQSQPQDTPVLP
jgi:hypothetical protein